MAGDVGEVMVRLGAQDMLSPKMAKASGNVARAGQRMTKTGKTLSKTLTAPLLAVGGAAVKMASDFESEMSKIQGLVGASGEQVEAYKEQVLDLSGDVAKSPQELAEALFFIESAGLKGAKAMDALESSAKASAAGMGETKDVANAVTNALNAYEEGSIDAQAATDVLTASVRAGKTEAADLAPQFGRVLPIASEMDISFDQLGGTLAFFTKMTGDSAKAGTFLEGILRNLIKPTAQGEKALSKLGTSYGELHTQIAQEGLQPTLVDLREEFEANGIEMSELFQDSNALSGALQLTGSQAKVAARILEETAESAGVTDEAFEVASETAQFKFDKAMAAMSKTMVELGSELLPLVSSALESIAGALSDAVAWWKGLDDWQKKAVGSLAAVAAAAGPVLVVAGSLARAIASLKLVMAGSSGTGGAVGATRRFTGALGGLRGMLLRGFALGVAIHATNSLIDAFQQGRAEAKSLGDEIIATSDSSEEAIRRIDKAQQEQLHTWGDVGDRLTSLSSFWDGLKDSMADTLDPWGALKDATGDLASGLGFMESKSKAANAEFESTGEILPSVTQFVADLENPLGVAGGLLADVGVASGDAADGVEDVGDEAHDARMSVEEFEDSLNSLFESSLGLERATIAYQEMLVDLNSTLQENQATLSLASQEGRDNRSAVLDGVEAARDHAVAMVNDGKSIDEATAAMQQHVADLKKQLIQAGHSEAAVQSYIDTLDLTPGNIKTTLAAETEQAAAEVRAFQGLLEAATADRSVDITTTRRLLTGGVPTGHDGGRIEDLPTTSGLPRGDETLVKARAGERLLTPEQNRDFEQGQGGDTVNIYNPQPRAAHEDLARANRKKAYLR